MSTDDHTTHGTHNNGGGRYGGTTPAGWYPDSQGTLRYWDGRAWTDHTQPASPAAPQPFTGGGSTYAGPAHAAHANAPDPAGKGKRSPLKVAALAAAAVVGILLFVSVVAALAGGGQDTTAIRPAADTTSVPSSSPTAGETGKATKAAPKTSTPAATKTTKAKPAPPPLTVAQENAIQSAEDYLDYSAFSRKGLIKQLEFEGYSGKDAELAVSRIRVDWMEQAAKSAKDYMDYSSFSRQGLINQLEFEGFTAKQARHGADSVGL